MWFVYFVTWLVPYLAVTGVLWLSGAYPLGVFSFFHASLWGTAVLALALIHHLDRSAAESLQAFRPALEVCEEEYSTLHYRLTNLPRRRMLIALVVGALVGVGEISTVPADVASGLTLFTSTPATIIETAMYIFGWIFFGSLIFHTAHQLGVVRYIYEHRTRVNLFCLDPI